MEYRDKHKRQKIKNIEGLTKLIGKEELLKSTEFVFSLKKEMTCY